MVMIDHTDRERGGRAVTFDELKAVKTPPPQGGRHRPVPHIDVWNTLARTLKRRGIGYEKPDIVLTHNRKARDGVTYADTAMFGTMKVHINGQGPGMDRMLGFRSSNIQVFAIGMVAGAKITVCTNLIFSGDTVVLKKKHTTNLNLRDSISIGVDQLHDAYGDFDDLIGMLQTRKITDTQARLTIYGLVEEQVIPARVLRPVHETYFDPKREWTDTTPRTAWVLYNAVTRVLRKEPLPRKMNMTQATTDYLNRELLRSTG